MKTNNLELTDYSGNDIPAICFNDDGSHSVYMTEVGGDINFIATRVTVNGLDIISGGTADLTNYYKKTETYSNTEVDAKILATSATTALTNYYTKTLSDARYYNTGQTYTTTQVDAKILATSATTSLVNYYTKTLSDARYYNTGQTYSKGELNSLLVQNKTITITNDQFLGMSGSAFTAITLLDAEAGGYHDIYSITIKTAYEDTYDITNVTVFDFIYNTNDKALATVAIADIDGTTDLTMLRKIPFNTSAGANIIEGDSLVFRPHGEATIGDGAIANTLYINISYSIRTI